MSPHHDEEPKTTGSQKSGPTAKKYNPVFLFVIIFIRWMIAIDAKLTVVKGNSLGQLNRV